MTVDVTTVVGGVFCLFPAALAVWLTGSTLGTKGLVFYPAPLVAPGGVVRVLVGLSIALGWLWACPGLVAFVAVSALVLALQHRLPKGWDGGAVHGLWVTPLGVRAVEREGDTLVLVLERGYRLAVPATRPNQPFLERITAQEAHR